MEDRLGYLPVRVYFALITGKPAGLNGRFRKQVIQQRPCSGTRLAVDDPQGVSCQVRHGSHSQGVPRLHHQPLLASGPTDQNQVHVRKLRGEERKVIFPGLWVQEVNSRDFSLSFPQGLETGKTPQGSPKKKNSRGRGIQVPGQMGKEEIIAAHKEDAVL